MRTRKYDIGSHGSSVVSEYDRHITDATAMPSNALNPEDTVITVALKCANLRPVYAHRLNMGDWE